MKEIKIIIEGQNISTEDLLAIGESTQAEILFLGKAIQRAMPKIEIIKSDVLLVDSQLIYRFLYDHKYQVVDQGTTAKLYINEKN